MPGPYNLEIQNDCKACPMRSTGRFCNLSDNSLDAIERAKFTTVYPKGATLFVEGETSRGIYILCSGRVKLTMSSAEGRTLIVNLVGPGEVLGISAAILGTTYEVSAETVEPAQVNFIRTADFLSILGANPDVSLRSAEQLSVRYHDAQREIRSFGLSHSASEKLARLILEWAEKGEKSSRGLRVKVLLTHEEIGQMLGTTRETVTRLIGDFKKKKIIEVRGSSVYIERPEALQQMCSF